ncbi:MAG: 50S ribosomal protein L9 [Bacteroidales bacterium]|jgi:large subunit ribosomal protein L9|nr:50S ribosomal protein L9 [Bacteroidales bacterium]
MEIILKQDVQNLGSKDDLLVVKNGYARNYLIPKGWAILASPSAKKVLSENIKQRAHKEAKLRAEAEKLAERINGMKLVIGAKTSSTGKIFGSVNTIQISEALQSKGFDIDRRSIVIKEEQVKEIGTYNARVKLHKDISADIAFEVVSE